MTPLCKHHTHCAFEMKAVCLGQQYTTIQLRMAAVGYMACTFEVTKPAVTSNRHMVPAQQE